MHHIDSMHRFENGRPIQDAASDEFHIRRRFGRLEEIENSNRLPARMERVGRLASKKPRAASHQVSCHDSVVKIPRSARPR